LQHSAPESSVLVKYDAGEFNRSTSTIILLFYLIKMLSHLFVENSYPDDQQANENGKTSVCNLNIL